MLRETKLLRWGLTGLILLAAILLFCSPSIQAQNWRALPPYNLLWPLWSPPLVTDFNWDPLVLLGTTPIITELSKNTVLPVQPAIVWDAILNPKGPVWLAYNIPPAFGGGLTLFEEIYGFMPFPPSYLLDSATGAPLPITYLPYYSGYLPTALKHFGLTIDFANLAYSFLYGLTPTEYSNLLTPALLWGIPPI
ncbi:MAG: hypothetical protein ACMUIS_03815 [bacterium]